MEPLFQLFLDQSIQNWSNYSVLGICCTQFSNFHSTISENKHFDSPTNIQIIPSTNKFFLPVSWLFVASSIHIVQKTLIKKNVYTICMHYHFLEHIFKKWALLKTLCRPSVCPSVRPSVCPSVRLCAIFRPV
jgi:hypothetical protein